MIGFRYWRRIFEVGLLVLRLRIVRRCFLPVLFSLDLVVRCPIILYKCTRVLVLLERSSCGTF